MKMSIGEDYYTGIYFSEDERGQYDVPDYVAQRWLNAERDYQDAQNEAAHYL